MKFEELYAIGYKPMEFIETKKPFEEAVLELIQEKECLKDDLELYKWALEKACIILSNQVSVAIIGENGSYVSSMHKSPEAWKKDLLEEE